MTDAQSNPSVACVVLTGAGKDFSSGMDLTDFSGEEEGEHPFYLAQQAIVEATELKRLGDPSDIADAVSYLALDAKFVTGQILTVDGGRSIAP
jgi:NAD(P)-dependent dehydrogenase (short-subunit alcohol dehydrogenase family)